MTEEKRKKRGRPRDADERESRRRELLDAAARIIERDGADVSMDDMAKEAGITKPILYSHFGDKAGLADALADHFADDLGARLLRARESESSQRAMISAMVDTYLAAIESAPNLYVFLVNGVVSRGRPVSRKLTHDLGSMTARLLGEQLRAAGVDSGGAEPWAFGIIGMVDMAAAWWLERRTMSRPAVVEYLTSLLWDGLGGNGLSLLDAPAAEVSDLRRRTATPSRTSRPTRA